MCSSDLLVVQNSVGHADLGAATGAATLFRTIGGSIGVSLFGTLFAQRLEAGLPGSIGTGATAGLTPAGLGQLPVAAREAYQQAMSSGIDLVFRWGALIALLAVLAAWVIREVPLRGLSGDAATAAAQLGSGLARPRRTSRRCGQRR